MLKSKLNLLQKKETTLMILIAVMALSWFFRYKPISHGYMLDRWTNTTVHLEDLQREESFLNKVLEDWSTNRDLSVKVIMLEKMRIRP